MHMQSLAFNCIAAAHAPAASNPALLRVLPMAQHQQVSRSCIFVVFADIDACAQSAAPCTDSGVGNVTCTDSAPPALGTTAGRTCACATGYEYIEGTGCQSKLTISRPYGCALSSL
jgi:hypothetical protein